MAVQAQLYSAGLQDWMVNNPVSMFEADFGFSFQDSQQQNLFFQTQSSQNLTSDCKVGARASSSSQSTCDSFISMPLFQSLDAHHFEMQKRELDCILQLQNEKLRYVLQEQRKQQLGILLKSVESKAICLMRQKEEDLAQATKKTMELEACLRKVQMETESWQRLAREKEAMVIDLSNTLEQVRERTCNIGQDAESFCCGSCEKEEEDSSKKMVCKGCNSRVSCVLFLPCRHLCSCKFCEAFLESCPVCQYVKEGSMEVFFV